MSNTAHSSTFCGKRDRHPADMDAFQTRTEESLAKLIKQRTILNVRKKERQKLYTALADVDALAPSKALYEEGLTGMRQNLNGTWKRWHCWRTAVFQKTG